MRFQAGTQIVLIIISVVIIFTVIKPKLADIGFEQNEVVTYRTALDNIGQYNQRLQNLIGQSKSMPVTDRENLFRYLPENIDAVAVGRDISNMATGNDLLLLDVVPAKPMLITTAVAEDGTVTDGTTDTGAVAPTPEEGGPEIVGGMYSQQFKVSVVGTYEQMKGFLKDLERNAYPLKIVAFNFELKEEEGLLTQYDLTVETYSLKSN